MLVEFGWSQKVPAKKEKKKRKALVKSFAISFTSRVPRYPLYSFLPGGQLHPTRYLGTYVDAGVYLEVPSALDFS